MNEEQRNASYPTTTTTIIIAINNWVLTITKHLLLIESIFQSTTFASSLPPALTSSSFTWFVVNGRTKFLINRALLSDLVDAGTGKKERKEEEIGYKI